MVQVSLEGTRLDTTKINILNKVKTLHSYFNLNFCLYFILLQNFSLLIEFHSLAITCTVIRFCECQQSRAICILTGKGQKIDHAISIYRETEIEHSNIGSAKPHLC